jgi:high-affinity iron transporter
MLSPAISACDGGVPTPPTGVLNSPKAIATGARLFAVHCAICHGAKGNGQGIRHAFMSPAPANLAVPEWSRPANVGRIYSAVRKGVPGTAMAAWPTLSDQQVWSVAAYVRTLSR